MLLLFFIRIYNYNMQINKPMQTQLITGIADVDVATDYC